MTTLGFRILPRIHTSPSLVSLFEGLPASIISDNMSRLSGSLHLRPYHRPGTTLLGTALTVRVRSGDNLMIHKALDMAEPGDIIVVDAGGDLTNSLFGELMMSYAMQRKLGGVVLNGAVRDADIIAAGSFPIYAAGVTHRGPYKDGPGEINVPIALDGMVIQPGDLVIGDADGLLCVPHDDVEQVLAACREKVALEQKTITNIRAGKHDTSWVDARLKAIGCDPTPR